MGAVKDFLKPTLWKIGFTVFATISTLTVLYWFFFILSFSGSCIQVIQAGRNPITGEVRNFPTPCDVPIGWKQIEASDLGN